MKMTIDKFTDIVNKDKDYLEKYQLETSEGTKKYKEKFYKNAVENRNTWVNEHIRGYSNYEEQVLSELKRRMTTLMPDDLNEEFDNRSKVLDDYLEAIICHNDTLDIGFRLKLDFLIASITEGVSLEYLNEVLKKYIDKFKDMGIDLVCDDFNYSVFTKEYMEAYFLNNKEDMLGKFEKVFFECPNFIHHIKMCLKNIIVKNKITLETILLKKTDEKVQSSFNATNLNLFDDYLNFKDEFKWDYLRDSYNTLQLFLGEKSIDDYLVDSDIRKKNYTKFYPNYYELNYENKLKINDIFKDFYNTLEVLNDFYRYKFILDDMVKRYGSKESSKANFDNKLKELTTSDKLRIKLNKDYYDCFVSKLFRKAKPEKGKLIKLQINEEVNKLNNLYDELGDAYFNYLIGDKLNDASSIYEFYELSLHSFAYLKNIFEKQFIEEEDFNLEKEFERFINFIYNPYNQFMIKINALANYDVCKVLTDKFVISGLSITTDDIGVNGIELTTEIVEFIVRCNLIDDCFLDSKKLKFICDVSKLN